MRLFASRCHLNFQFYVCTLFLGCVSRSRDGHLYLHLKTSPTMVGQACDLRL